MTRRYITTCVRIIISDVCHLYTQQLVYSSNIINNSSNKLFWDPDDNLIHGNHLRKSELQTIFLMITVALATFISLHLSPWQQIVAKLYKSVSRALSKRCYSDRKLSKHRNLRRKSRRQTPLKHSLHQYTRVHGGQSKKTVNSYSAEKAREVYAKRGKFLGARD
jgi:hypothetical protein